MVLRPLVLFLLLLASAARSEEDLAAELPAADVAPPSGPVLARNDDVAFVRRRGVELYERHQATLVALDAAREVGLSDIAPEGWVTLREDDGLRVRFVGSCEDGPCGLLDVLIDSERLAAEALYPPVPLSDREGDAWRAKQLVFARQEVTCEVPYNAITFPPEQEGDSWTVYLVPQPAESDLVAVSGHARVRVDLARGAVVGAEEFSASCIVVQRTAEQSQLAIDYAWAPMPAETHVLNSLLHQIVFFVGTSGGVFRVNGDVVERVADVGPGA